MAQKLVLGFGLGISFLFALLGCQSTSSVVTPNSSVTSEEHLDFAGGQRTRDCCSAQGGHAAISSPGELSSKAGLAILKAGGNAVDAAVATAFCLAVEDHQSLGLGGGGFMLLHLSGDQKGDYFVDFRETAPHRATRDMFVDAHGHARPNLSQDGVLAVGVPGFVAGLFDIQKKWGKLPWKRVVEPAIHLAREGVPVTSTLAREIDAEKDKLQKNDYTRGLLFHDGQPLRVGDRFVQHDLAKTLGIIAREGKQGFYAGSVAKKMTDFMSTRGGILDQEDLDHYQVKYRDPLVADWKGYTFLTSPPPSAGGILLVEILNILRGFDLRQLATSEPDYVHLMTEAFKYGYADRSRFIGDPDFVKTDYAELISQGYADAIRQKLDLAKDVPSSQIQPGGGEVNPHHSTGHLSYIDDNGNAISATLTINDGFGAKFAVPGTGIFMNDEMDDFSSKTGEQNLYGLTASSDANAIAPGKRPVSSMMPTIVLEGSKPRLVIGAAGGSRIMSSVIEVSLDDLVLYPGNLRLSVFAPRFHHQWLPDQLDLEAGFTSATRDRLSAMGHKLGKWPFPARVEAVQRDPGGGFTAVCDPRTACGAAAD